MKRTVRFRSGLFRVQPDRSLRYRNAPSSTVLFSCVSPRNASHSATTGSFPHAIAYCSAREAMTRALTYAMACGNEPVVAECEAFLGETQEKSTVDEGAFL